MMFVVLLSRFHFLVGIVLHFRKKGLKEIAERFDGVFDLASFGRAVSMMDVVGPGG